MVRPDASPAERTRLDAIGLDLTEAHPRDRDALAAACAGSTCVVSALNGLHDVMIDRKREGMILHGDSFMFAAFQIPLSWSELLKRTAKESSDDDSPRLSTIFLNKEDSCEKVVLYA